MGLSPGWPFKMVMLGFRSVPNQRIPWKSCVLASFWRITMFFCLGSARIILSASFAAFGEKRPEAPANPAAKCAGQTWAESPHWSLDRRSQVDDGSRDVNRCNGAQVAIPRGRDPDEIAWHRVWKAAGQVSEHDGEIALVRLPVRSGVSGVSQLLYLGCDAAKVGPAAAQDGEFFELAVRVLILTSLDPAQDAGVERVDAVGHFLLLALEEVGKDLHAVADVAGGDGSRAVDEQLNVAGLLFDRLRWARGKVAVRQLLVVVEGDVVRHRVPGLQAFHDGFRRVPRRPALEVHQADAIQAALPEGVGLGKLGHPLVEHLLRKVFMRLRGVFRKGSLHALELAEQQQGNLCDAVGTHGSALELVQYICLQGGAGLNLEQRLEFVAVSLPVRCI